MAGGGVTADLSLQPHVPSIQTDDPGGLPDHLGGSRHLHPHTLTAGLVSLPLEHIGGQAVVVSMVSVAHTLQVQVLGVGPHLHRSSSVISTYDESTVCTQLSPGIILMSGGAHDGGMLQS